MSKSEFGAAAGLAFSRQAANKLVASQSAMLALTGIFPGQVVIREDDNYYNYLLKSLPASNLSNWQPMGKEASKVADVITDGVTTIAPSQNAVFDALALKATSLSFRQESTRFVESTYGSDANNGLTLDKPFATVPMAWNGVNPSGQVKILGGSTYNVGTFTFDASKSSIKTILDNGVKITGTINLVVGNSSMQFFDGKIAATVNDASGGTCYFNNIDVAGSTLNFSNGGYKFIGNSTSTPNVINLTGTGGTLLLQNITGGIVSLNVGAGWTVVHYNCTVAILSNAGTIIDGLHIPISGLIANQTALNVILAQTSSVYFGYYIVNFDNPVITGMTIAKGDVFYKVSATGNTKIYTFGNAPASFSLIVSATQRSTIIKDIDKWINSKTETDASLVLKQNITDNTLNTTSKTVPGAINELKASIGGAIPSDIKTTSGTIGSSANTIINSENSTTQTLTTQNIGTKRYFKNIGAGLAKITASGVITDDSLVPLSTFPLMQGEELELESQGSGNWITLKAPKRTRVLKMLNSNGIYVGPTVYTHRGDIGHQPSYRFASKNDGTTQTGSQVARRLFPTNPTSGFADAKAKWKPESIISGDSGFLLHTNNILYGFGENEGGQFNQGNQIDASSLVTIAQDVVWFRCTASAGSNGYEQNCLIYKTTDGHIRYSGPDRQGQAGLGTTATVRTTSVVLTAGHPDSAIAFTKAATVPAFYDFQSNILTITAAGNSGLNSNAGILVGQKVSGTNIPANTTVVSLIGTNQIQISNAPTGGAPATNVTLSFYGWLNVGDLEDCWISSSYDSFHILWQFNNGRKFFTGANQGAFGNGATTTSAIPIEVTQFWGRIGAEPINDGLNWRIKQVIHASGYSDGTTAAIHNWCGMLLENIITGEQRHQRSGQNTWGMIGNNTTTQVLSPFLVASTILTDAPAIPVQGRIRQIATQGAAIASVFVVFENGTVWENGRNDVNQLGDGTVTQRNTPFQLRELDGVTFVTDAREVLSNNFNASQHQWDSPAFIKRVSGKTSAQGYNLYANAGIGGLANIVRPAFLPYDEHRYGAIMQIAQCGLERTRKIYFAVTESGKVLIWGRNYEDQVFEQLGRGFYDQYIGRPIEFTSFDNLG